MKLNGNFIRAFHRRLLTFSKLPRADFDHCAFVERLRNNCTVKPVLSGHSKIDKTKVLMINGSFMQVKSIAECSPFGAF